MWKNIIAVTTNNNMIYCIKNTKGFFPPQVYFRKRKESKQRKGSENACHRNPSHVRNNKPKVSSVSFKTLQWEHDRMCWNTVITPALVLAHRYGNSHTHTHTHLSRSTIRMSSEFTPAKLKCAHLKGKLSGWTIPWRHRCNHLNWCHNPEVVCRLRTHHLTCWHHMLTWFTSLSTTPPCTAPHYSHHYVPGVSCQLVFCKILVWNVTACHTCLRNRFEWKSSAPCISFAWSSAKPH